MDDEQKHNADNDENIENDIFTSRLKSDKSKIYTGGARRLNLYHDSFIAEDNKSPDKTADYVPLYKDGKDGQNQENYLGYDHPAKRLIRKRERKRTKEILGWILSIGIAICAAFLIRGFVFEIILVDGDSMLPTLYTNERVAIEKLTRYGGMPERGDIIIVKYPNMDGTFVKRAIGLPGETIEIKNSVVYIDGEPIEEDYVNTEPYADMEAFVVPENHVFVMGDNRAHSLDSRAEYIGPIPHDSIIGHGLFVIWPFSNIHSVQN